MDKKFFKREFERLAKKYLFQAAHGGWYKESNECIMAMGLQKSNYSDFYYVNINVFVRNRSDKRYVIDKHLIKVA